MPRRCPLVDRRWRGLHAIRALGVLAVAVALAGCGSYTKHDFITSADAICAGAVRQTRAVPPPSSRQVSALAPYLGKVSPILESEERQIRALKHPTQSGRDRAALERYLAALHQFVADFKHFAAAAATGNARALASAEAALRTSSLDALAKGYGLRSCGTPGATVA
jgi:hypothetical protein